MSIDPAHRRGLLRRPGPLDATHAARVAWAMSLARALEATPAADGRRAGRLLRALRDAFDAGAAAVSLVSEDERVELEAVVGWNDAAAAERARRRVAKGGGDASGIEDAVPLADRRVARAFLFRASSPFDAHEADWLRAIHAACAWAYEGTKAGVGGAAGGDDARSRLSPAVRATFDLLLGSASEREIAERLYRSPHTIHTHVKQIYRTFGVRSRPELMARVLARRDVAATDAEPA